MGTYTGGSAAEIITPVSVSPTVSVTGAPRPSNADDIIRAGAGDDTVDGGKGDDWIDGGFGADLLSGGDGDDTFAWQPGSGSDTIDGGKGVDLLQFDTSNSGETVALSGQSGHVILTRNLASIVMDIDNVEEIAFGGPGGGADRYLIGDLAGTEVKRVDIDLGAVADGLVDIVSAWAGSGNRKIVLTNVEGAVNVAGLPAALAIAHAEASDLLAITAGGGNDTLDATALAGGMTVRFDGGEGLDTLVFRGGSGGDTIILASSSPTPEGEPIYAEIGGVFSQIDVVSVESLLVEAGAGADLINARTYHAATPLTVNAGDGADTVFGGANTDAIFGGKGSDLIDGHFGADFLFGGDGDDTFVWNAGGGSDIVDGGTGIDALVFNTTNIGEIVELKALAAGHVLLTRNIAAIATDLDNVERIAFAGLGGGADRYFIGDLKGTDIKTVEVDLGAVADNTIDVVSLTARDTAERLVVTTTAAGVFVDGLAFDVTVTHAEAADRLTILTGGGADTVDASALAGGMTLNYEGGEGEDVLAWKGGSGADTFVLFGSSSPTGEGYAVIAELQGRTSQLNLIDVETLLVDMGAGSDLIAATGYHGPARLIVNAGDGADTVRGGSGADVINGGRGGDLIDGNFGADQLIGGEGDDSFVWNAGGGSDTVDGGAGIDTLVFNTTATGEIISVLDEAGHAIVTRNIAAVTLDLDGVERIAFGGAGLGEDVFFVAALGGTDLRRIDIDLGAPAGGGDGQADAVTLTGAASGERILVTGAAGSATVRGLPVEVQVIDADFSDWLTVSAFGGSDTFDVSAFGGGIGLRLNGGAGSDRFILGANAGLQVEIVEFRAHSLSTEADLIVLRDFADASFAAALASHHIAQDGQDVIIADGSGAFFRLIGVSLADLGASDFLFG